MDVATGSSVAAGAGVACSADVVGGASVAAASTGLGLGDALKLISLGLDLTLYFSLYLDIALSSVAACSCLRLYEWDG